MYNTVTNTDNITKGLRNFTQGLSYFDLAPSVINYTTLAEDRPYAELEALADQEMYNGKGVRRYDGSWSTIDDLDTDLFGDNMMRVTYNSDNKPSLENYDITKSLGWLANTNVDLKNYIDATDDNTRQAYYNLLDGDAKKLLKQINEVTPTQDDVVGRFTIASDENGNPYWQEVLVDKNSRKKLEAAGVSLVNSYGARKYSDGVITSGVRSLIKTVADVVPTILQLRAATKDIGEALVNAIAGNGFTSEYDITNEWADNVSEWLDESMIGKTSYQAENGVFNSWEGFASGLGQGLGSLIQYGGVGKIINIGGKILTKGAARLASNIASKNLGKLSEAANVVKNTLSADALNTQSLGAISKRLNNLLNKHPEAIPMWSAGITLNFNEAYQAAKDAGLPLEDAAAVGFITGILNTALENKLGSNVLTKYLIGERGATRTAKAIINEVGGDVNKLMDKAVSDQIARNVMQKIGGALQSIGRTPVIGSMLEEGGEEMAQAFIKNTVESFYDSWIAPATATEGKGLFGTNAFGKDEWVNMAEEGVIGGILGGLGGFVNSRRKEDKSIIPFIANGDLDAVKAGAALAKQKQAITQEQYDGIVERATKLDELRRTNQGVFLDAITVNSSDQLDYANSALKMLRDQNDYATRTQELSNTDSVLKDLQNYNHLVRESLETTNSLSGIKAFAQQLEDNGKRQQAKLLKQQIKESERQADELFKNTKDSNPIQSLADKLAKNQYAKTLLNLKQEISNADNLVTTLNNLKISLAKDNQNLSEIDVAIANNKQIATSDSKIEALLQEYDKEDTVEDRKTAIRKSILSELTRQNNSISSNKQVKAITGYMDYIQVIDQIKQAQILKRLAQSDLSNTTSDSFKKGFEELRNTVKDGIIEAEKNKAGQKEAKKEQEKKQQEKDKEPVNTQLDNLYTEYKALLQSEQNPTEERKQRIDNIVNGDETTQIEALQQELTDLTNRINSLTAEERKTELADTLRSNIGRIRKLLPYLRQKYGVNKTEADKNKRYKSNLAEDNRIFQDREGNKYIVDNTSTQYSENEGMIYRIAKLEENQDKKDAVFQEYKEGNDKEFLSQLVDEDGESFSIKVRQDKRITALNARKAKKDIYFNFEPVSESESRVQDSQKEIVQKVNTFNGKLKGIPVGDKFKERLADPRMDSRQFEGRAEAYIWDKASEQVKTAKKHFDEYRATSKTFDQLTQEQRDELLDYLPLQLVLTHPYLSDKNGQPYRNIVSIPARKSATSERYSMDEDQIEQRTNLIKVLLDKGELIIQKGDIEIQPGYFNIDTVNAPTTIVDEYGVEHKIEGAYTGDLRDIESLDIEQENGIYYIHSGNFKFPVTIGIAGETGVIYYTDDSSNTTRNADGHGSPGTPYLILPGFLNLNDKHARYPLKLNPRKIDKATATTVARLMYSLAKGYATKEVTLETPVVNLPDLFGISTQDKDLTIGDVLEDVIYQGRRTLQNDPDPAVNKEYLKNKQLYIDYRKGQVRYGDKETILGDTKEDMDKFINWMTRNKSFSIDRSRILSKDKMKYTYSIEGGYSSVAGKNYVTNLLDNKAITTNLMPKGSLFKGQFIRLKSIKSNAPVNPVSTPKPVVKKTEDSQSAVQPAQSEKQGVVSAKKVNNTMKGVKAVKESIKTATEGTTLTVKLNRGDIDIVDEFDNKLGSINDFSFTVKEGTINGKKVDLQAATASQQGLFGTIVDIIKEKYPDASIFPSSFEEVTVIPPVITPVTPVTLDPNNQVNRVDEVFNSTTDKLKLKFKTKPSKADIDGFLASLVNKTTNIAKLYGFKDYAEARQLLQVIGSNGKTLEQNLIEFMQNIGEQPPTSGPSRIEQIAATVFKVPDQFTKGATRLRTVSETERITDKEKKQLSRILGKRANAIEWVNDFIKVLDYAGNPAEAYGITTRTATQIYTGAATGTGFHEAFHNVSLFNLTNEQREHMYEEAKKQNSSLRNASNQEVEEYLADRFMHFALEMQERGQVRATEYKGLTGFFKRMWDWITRQVGFRPSYQDINTLFKKIYDGQYSRVRTNKKSLIYFDNAYGKNAKVPLLINGVTLNMDSRTIDKIVTNLTAQLLYDNDITSLESVRKGIDLSGMKTQMQQLLDAYSSIVNTTQDFNELEQASKLVNVYSEIVNNWDSVFRPLIENKLFSYGIRRREEDATYTIDEDLKNLVNDEVVSAWEINSKHNAKAEVRMLFLALPKTSQRDPVTGLIQYENPDVVWYNTISKLHSASNVTEMLDLLQQLAKDVNTLRGIENDINPYNTLYNMLTSANQTLQTQFFVTMKKHRNKFVNFTFQDDGNGLDINMADADINKRSRQIGSTWSKQFSQSGITQETRKKELTNLQTKYEQVIADVSSTNTTYEENVRSVVKLLAGLNIIVDQNTIKNIINRPEFKAVNDKKSLSNFLQSAQFSNVFSKRGRTFINDIIKNKIPQDKLLTALQRQTLVRTLSDSYVKMNPTSEDDSVPGPDGNLVYSYSEYNTITQMFEEWLKDEQYVNQLLADPYCKNSLWLSYLKDGNVRKQLAVSTMLAVMNKDNYVGSRGYLDLSDMEDLIIKMEAIMQGKMPLPTLANKKSFYYIEGLPKQEVKLIRSEDGVLQISERIIDIFAGYAQDEINAIKAAEKLRANFLNSLGVSLEQFNSMTGEEQQNLIWSSEDSAVHYYSQLVENYHYNSKGGKIILDGNGYKFRYFRELQDKLSKSNIQSVEEFTNTDEFRDAIRRYVNHNINATIKLFIDNKIINNNRNAKLKDLDSLKDDSKLAIEAIVPKALNYLPMVEVKGKKVMMNAPETILQVIADYSINTAMSTLEFEKIVSGDLAFYKSKNIQAALDDRVKRYSALTSTRQIMNNQVVSNDDYSVDFDTKYYTVMTLATNKTRLQDTYDMLYDRYVGTEESPGLLYQRFIDFAENEVEGYTGKSREELYDLAKQDTERRLAGYLDNDPTDAQVWISPYMFRKLAIMNGEWNSAKENAFNLLMSEEQLTVDQELEAQALVMQPLKYIHYGFRFNEDGLKVPIYDKMSLSTLYPSVVKGTRMYDLYKYIISNNIDMVKMDSAVKSGNVPKQPYLNEDGTVSNLDHTLVYSQEFKYMGKQLVTDPHEIENTTLLTQFIKIAVSNLELDRDYTLDGRSVKGRDVLDYYNDAIVELSNRGVARIKEKFGYKDGKIDKRKFIELLHQAGLQTSVPQNLLDALKYSEQEQDYYIELSTLPSLNWIQSRLISAFSKEVIDITIPGNAFYQTTSFGMDFTNMYRKLVGDNTVKRYNDKLRFRNEHGRMEVKLSINLFRGVIPSKYKTFEEQRKYVLANKELFGFAYRVPTQGMNSTLPIEIVDVLPSTSGDVIFLPLEITTLTGSDFDIDKMYLARYNYYDDNGTMRKVEFIDEADYSSKEEFLEASWNSKYGYTRTQSYQNDKNIILGVVDYVGKRLNQNRALTSEDKISLIDLATDYSKYISRTRIMQLLSSTDSDFDKLSSIRNYVLSKLPTSKEVIPVDKFIQNHINDTMWTLNTERAIQNRLLDVFSSTLTSNNHFIDATTPLDVTTAPLKDIVGVMDQYFETGEEVTDLSPLFPVYQEAMKSKNTGADAGIGPMALINVFRTLMQISDMHLVGITDDLGINIIQSLNIDNLNKIYDYEGLSILDWTSALINAHVDAAKDPYIMRLNVNRYTYNMVAFMISTGFGRSTFYFLPQPILKDLATAYIRQTGSQIGTEDWERYSKQYMKDTEQSYEDMIEEGQPNRIPYDEVLTNIHNVEWLKKQIATPVDQRDSRWYATQLSILDVFRSMSNYANALRDCINAVQIDTKKFGINSIELVQFQHLIEKVQNSNLIANPEDLFTRTFLQQKYNNSIQLLFDMMSTELLDFTPGFINIVEDIERMVNIYYIVNPDVPNLIANEVKSSIYGRFFNQYLKDHDLSVKSLFFGENSVVNQISRLQQQIAEGQYRELEDNELLKMLLPNVLNNDTDPMRFENSITKQRDTDSKNAYTFAWMDLLEHEDPYIRNIGNNLILYSFYLGGGMSSGIYNFYDLAPYGYLANLQLANGETFQSYIKKVVQDMNTQLGQYNNLTAEIYEDVFRSAWKNDKIVPVFKLNNKRVPVQVQSNKTGIEYVKLPDTVLNFMSNQLGGFKPFIKLEYKGNPNQANIYRLVGAFVNPNTGEQQLVYGRANKLGYSYTGFRIKENGNTELPSNQGEEYINPTEESFKNSFIGDRIFEPIQPFQTHEVTSAENETVTPDGDVEVTTPIDLENQIMTQEQFDQFMEQDLEQFMKEGKRIKEQCKGK